MKKPLRPLAFLLAFVMGLSFFIIALLINQVAKDHLTTILGGGFLLLFSLIFVYVTINKRIRLAQFLRCTLMTLIGSALGALIILLWLYKDACAHYAFIPGWWTTYIFLGGSFVLPFLRYLLHIEELWFHDEPSNASYRRAMHD